MSCLLIKNGTLLTLNISDEILEGDILIEDDRIKKIGKNIVPPPHTKILEAKECWVFPGFIQTHVHLCPTSGYNMMHL